MGIIADGNVIEANDILGCMRTTAEAGEAIAIGKACYIKESDGKAYISDSSSANFFTGIAFAGVDSAADVTLVTKGLWVTSGLTDKEIYYLGSSGAISTTVSGIRIGSADGTTDLYIDTGTTNQGSSVQNFKSIKLNPFGPLSSTHLYSFILPFSSVIWECEDNRTVDAGATKVAGGAVWPEAWICKANSAKALNCNSTGSEMGYTIDSGTTWIETTTKPANCNTVTGADYTIDGLIVICGNTTSDKGIWFSTDDGANFTKATTAPEDCAGVGMHDSTHGIAINYTTSQLWFTINGGIDWTATGDEMTSNANVQRATIYCYASGANVTDFKCLVMQQKNGNTGATAVIGNVEYYDGTGDSLPIYYGAGTGYAGTATNFTLLDNGTLCFGFASGQYSADDSDIQTANVIATTNPTASVITGGVLTTIPTFYQIPLGLCGSSGNNTVFGQTHDAMNQYNTNQILVFGSSHKLWQIDMSGVT